MASHVGRVTVSLPLTLLDAIDRTLARPAESRSAVIRRLIEDALRADTERRDVEQYIRSYRDDPQRDEELGWSDWMTTRRLADGDEE